MSGSTSTFGLTTPTLSSQATSAIAGSAASAVGGSGTSSAAGALQSLSGNYTDFLQMLMTQLQNQDPTSPMNTDTFTTELVQFSSVEQQINTNSSLNQLIQLTQSGEVLQGSALVGHQVSLNSTSLPLQSGTGEVQFTTPSAEPVVISITDSTGNTIAQSTVNAQQGSNTWTWNGKAANGVTEPDGAYNVTVTSGSGTTVTPVPFTVVGTATGVVNNNGSLTLQVGGVTTSMSNINSVLN
jgi:flagellar basal-body rod modification protein FlgD